MIVVKWLNHVKCISDCGDLVESVSIVLMINVYSSKCQIWRLFLMKRSVSARSGSSLFRFSS